MEVTRLLEYKSIFKCNGDNEIIHYLLENIHIEVEEFVGKNFPPKVQLLKTAKREGLIRARIFGAKKATGQVKIWKIITTKISLSTINLSAFKVLIFLDSHCEVNREWVQPLIARIQENRTFVVTPIIDIINSDTFQYTSSPLVRGGFNWGLHFKWDSLPDDSLKTNEDFVKPILYERQTNI